MADDEKQRKRAEDERRKAEQKARREAELRARDEAEKRAKEEESRKKEAERLAKEQEQQRRRDEELRLKQAEEARREDERRARLEAERKMKEAEQARRVEEQARKDAERKAAEEAKAARKLEEERKRAEEEHQRQADRDARARAEQLRREQEERRKAELQGEKERLRREKEEQEKRRRLAEVKRREEAEAAKAAVENQRKAEAEKKRLAELAAKGAERRERENAERLKKEELIRRGREEQARRLAEAQAADEARRKKVEEAARLKSEEAAKKEDERKAALEAEAKKGEDEARARVEERIRRETERVLRETRIPEEVLDRFVIAATRDGVTPSMKVLTHYWVGPAEVTVAEEGGKGRYLVNEPAATPEDMRLYKTLMGTIYYSPKPVGEVKDRKEYINALIDDPKAGPNLKVPDASKEVLRYYLTRDVAGYGILDVMMNDQDVEEVECGGFATPITVVHRDYTEFLRLETNITLGSEEVVAETVQKLAQRAGKSVTTAYPYADFLLPEGHRGSATFSNEISLPGSTFDIRKFPENPLTITNLLKAGTMSPLLAAYQWMVMENRGFTLVTGPVSSGKTTILNTLMSTLQPSAKIITVEDTPELKIVHQNWIRLITRSAYTLGAREVGLFDLVKASLRYRPDYLVVGEVRGAEIQSLVQAAAVGHGALTTIHADSPESAIVRMRSPPLSVGESFLLLIWNFLQMSKPTLPNGKQVRRVTSVTELVPDPSTLNFKLAQIFQWDPVTDSFAPDDAAEVVRRDSRLKTVMALRGWTNEGMVEELNKRAVFLRGLVEDGIYNYKEVAAKIFSYYEDKRRYEVDIVQR